MLVRHREKGWAAFGIFAATRGGDPSPSSATVLVSYSHPAPVYIIVLQSMGVISDGHRGVIAQITFGIQDGSVLGWEIAFVDSLP